MDCSFSFPATQVCDQQDLECSQIAGSTQNTNKIPIGILTIKGEDFTIYSGITTIGRLTINDVVIKDASVSKHHAEIEGNRKRTFVTDLKSLNGTSESRVKFHANRAYELIDGACIKFGNVEAYFKKCNNVNGSLLKTPSVPKFDRVIANTPDSTLNSTNDDSSVVYGTQTTAQQSKKCDSSGVHDLETKTDEEDIFEATRNNTDNIHDLETQQFSSPSVRKTIMAKNLQKEYSKVEGGKITKSDSIYEAETQDFRFKSPTTSGNLQRVSKTKNLDVVKKQLATDNIFEEVTQAFESTNSRSNNIVPDSDEEEIDSMEDPAIKEKEIESVPISDSKKSGKCLKDDSDTDEDGIFEAETQNVFTKNLSAKSDNVCTKNLSTNSDNFHEQTTQIFEATSSKIASVMPNDEVHKKKIQTLMCPTSTPKETRTAPSKVEDSDTDEDGIFEEPTQNFSAIEKKIHEVETQEVGVELRKESSKINNEEPTQKVLIKLDKIHELETQVCSKPSDFKTDSIDFEGPTQKFAAEDDTQVFQFTKSGKLTKIPNIPEELPINTEGPTQKILTKEDEIHEMETQALGKNLQKDDSETDEEGDFEGPTQKIPTYSKSLSPKTVNRKTSAKEEAIYELETQAVTSHESREDYSKTDEIDFEGPTQKLFTEADRIHEDETQVFQFQKDGKLRKIAKIQDNTEGPTQKILTKEDEIHEMETQKSTGHELEKEDSETDEEGDFETKIDEDAKFKKPENLSKVGETLDEEPTQKISTENEIHDMETQAVTNDELEKNDSETDEEGVFEEPEKQILTKEKDSKMGDFETEEATQKIETKPDDAVFEISKAGNSDEKIISDSNQESSRDKKDDFPESRKSPKIPEDPNIVPDSETDDDGIFENEIPKCMPIESETVSKSGDKICAKPGENTNSNEKNSANIRVENLMSKMESSVSDLSDCIGFSPRGSSRSELRSRRRGNQKKVDNPVNLESKSDLKSKTDSETNLETKSDKECKTSVKTAKKVDSDSEVESVLKNKVQKRRNSRTVSKSNPSPKPSTSKDPESDVFEKDVDTNKPVARRFSRHKDSEKKKVSEEKDDSSFKEPFAESGKEKEKRRKKEKSVENSPSVDYNLSSRFASIEDIEYETAVTQPIDDVQTPEIKVKRTEKSPVKRGRFMNDTVEENLNLMFDGSSESIEEPNHMLTQQLRNILEETVVSEETSPTRPRSARKIEKNSPSVSERSLKSPKVDADNSSPRMSKLNIIRTKRATAEKKELKKSESSDEKSEIKNQPLKKRPLKSVDGAGTSTAFDETRELEETKGRRERKPKNSSSGFNEPEPRETSSQETKAKRARKPTNQTSKDDTNSSALSETQESQETKLKRGRKPKNKDDTNSSALSETQESQETKLKRGRKTKSQVNKDDSNVSNQSKESQGTRPKRAKKQNDETQIDSSSRRTSKRNADNSSSSVIENSTASESDISKTSLKVPAKPKRGSGLKNTKKVTDSAETEVEEKKKSESVKEVKGRREIKTKKEVESKSEDESKKEVKNKKETENKREVRNKKEVENKKHVEKKEEIKTKKEVVSARNKRQVNQEKDIVPNTSTSSSSYVESSFNESTSKAVNPEVKKVRGRKRKNVNEVENSRMENTTVSSLNVSSVETDANLTLSSPSRTKRSRFSSPLKHKVLFTGIPVKNYQKNLTKLGLSDTEDLKNCTILVTDKVRRTNKFLCALSQGIPIVSVDWITDSAKKSNIQDLEQYIVKDPVAEAKFSFNLSESIQKARNTKLLAGYTILFTPNLTAPPVAELKGMVTACGGKSIIRPPAKWAQNTLIISDQTDLENAKKFMAKAPKSVTLHSTEFLLTGILKQEVDLKSYLLNKD